MIPNIFKIKLDLVSLIIIIMILLSGLLPPFLNLVVSDSQYGQFRILDIAYIFMGIFILIYHANEGNKIDRLWIYLILITGAVTIINYQDNPSLDMIIAWLSFLMTTAIIVYKPDISNSKYILYTILLVCIINIAFGLMIFLGGDIIVRTLSPNYYLTHSRTQPFCIFGGPIMLAFLCLITMAISSLLWKERFPITIALSNALLLLLTVLWASRSGFLAALAAYIIIYWRGRKKFIFLPAGLALVLTFILSSSYVREETRFTIWDFSDHSSFLRYTAAVYTMDKLRDHYLFGTGPGVIFNRGDRDKYADIITKSNVPLMVREGYIMPTEPHNTYLLFFLEYGFVALGVFLLFILQSLKTSNAFRRHFNDFRFYQLSLVIIFIIYGLTESLMYNLRFSVLLWSCLTILHLKESQENNIIHQHKMAWV